MVARLIIKAFEQGFSFVVFRWEEEKKEDGVKWNYLEHKGPMFAPPYEPLPKNVKFYYNGELYRIIN